MSLSLFYKMYGSILSPLLVALSGAAIFDQSSLPSVYVVGLIVIAFFVSLRIVVKCMHLIATQKQVEAKKRYNNKSFDELKTLFLANPHEAALFIEISKMNKSPKHAPVIRTKLVDQN
jgi:hypothetical protein